MIRAAASRAASRPSLVSRLCLASSLRMANSNTGSRCATRSRTACSPCFSRRSHGSRPSGCTATNVWVTKCSSRSNARSAARCPAASPSKVKMTSPRNWSASISSRRRILMCPSPNEVPEVATAVRDPGQVAGHDVGVPLDDDRLAALRDLAFGQVRPVQHGALLEQRGLRRVQVLRAVLVRVELAGAERDHVAGQVADRPDQAAAEPVHGARGGPGWPARRSAVPAR